MNKISSFRRFQSLQFSGLSTCLLNIIIHCSGKTLTLLLHTLAPSCPTVRVNFSQFLANSICFRSPHNSDELVLNTFDTDL